MGGLLRKSHYKSFYSGNPALRAADGTRPQLPIAGCARSRQWTEKRVGEGFSVPELPVKVGQDGKMGNNYRFGQF